MRALKRAEINSGKLTSEHQDNELTSSDNGKRKEYYGEK